MDYEVINGPLPMLLYGVEHCSGPWRCTCPGGAARQAEASLETSSIPETWRGILILSSLLLALAMD